MNVYDVSVSIYRMLNSTRDHSMVATHGICRMMATKEMTMEMMLIIIITTTIIITTITTAVTMAKATAMALPTTRTD